MSGSFKGTMMNSTIFEYIRKLSLADSKTLSQKALKTAEEVGELAKVVLPYDNVGSTQHRFVHRDRILEEVVDVMLCARSIAYELGFDDAEIESKTLVKARYWEELQQRESEVSFPIPFEIHVTVKAVCGSIGVSLS